MRQPRAWANCQVYLLLNKMRITAILTEGEKDNYLASRLQTALEKEVAHADVIVVLLSVNLRALFSISLTLLCP